MTGAAEALNGTQPTADQTAPPAAVPAPTAVPLPPIADDRPELVVGAAFAGGLALALLFKRLAR